MQMIGATRPRCHRGIERRWVGEGKKENGGDWMAAPSSSSSYLNSTCGLLDLLDLNKEHAESMKEMESEWITDVPDTPDRLAARQINGGQFIQMETGSSLSNRLRKPDFMMEKGMNGMKGVGLLVSENGHDPRLDSNSKNIPDDDFKGRKNTIILSPRENSYALQNNLLLRKGGREKYSCQGPKPFICPRRVDKGINISVGSPSKPPHCQENTAVPQIREHDLKYRHQTVNHHVATDFKIGNNEQSALYMPIAPKKPNMNIKGKEKVIEESFQDVGLSMIHKKGIEKSNNSNNRHEKQVLDPRQFVSSPRTTGHKRLVRNGCISPHNIATKTKSLSEQCEKSCRAVDQSNLGNMPSSSPSCLIDIQDIVAEDTFSNKDKGKGIMRQPSKSHDDDDDVRVICASSSDMEKAFGANRARTSRLDASECSEEVGVWRRTHNHSRRGIVLSNPSGNSFKKIDNVERISNRKIEIFMERQTPSRQEHVAKIDCAGNAGTAQRDSSIVPKIDQTIGSMHTEKKLNKRQKKHGSTSQVRTSCYVPDVEYVGMSGESSNSRSTRLQHRSRDNLNEVIEVDELSPEMRNPDSQTVGCPNDDTSDARTRQLEADEMLARELQEQLYQEMPIGGEEIDEHLAMALQQVEHGLFTPSRRTYSNRRGSLVAQANRRTRSQSVQNSSNRTRTRVTHSARMAQMRNQFFGGSHRVSTRQRNVNFPRHMDLDMRLDILEALEAAVGDMEDVRMNRRGILHLQRDFNENDYEMLLSLDENNHCHAGASTNRINSLPQSTVQTDSMEEACAICLDTPTIGDIIRHLPCFHKFHKDCIDPWLQRRTSCPVCKLSIT